MGNRQILYLVLSLNCFDFSVSGTLHTHLFRYKRPYIGLLNYKLRTFVYDYVSQ